MVVSAILLAALTPRGKVSLYLLPFPGASTPGYVLARPRKGDNLALGGIKLGGYKISKRGGVGSGFMHQTMYAPKIWKGIVPCI